jgi:hypothetical protein
MAHRERHSPLRYALPMLLTCYFCCGEAAAFPLNASGKQAYAVSGAVIYAHCEMPRQNMSRRSPAVEILYKLQHAYLTLEVRSDAGVWQTYHIRDVKDCLSEQINPHLARPEDTRDFPQGAKVELEVRASRPPDSCRVDQKPETPLEALRGGPRNCDFYEVTTLSVNGRKIF